MSSPSERALDHNSLPIFQAATRAVESLNFKSLNRIFSRANPELCYFLLSTQNPEDCNNTLLLNAIGLAREARTLKVGEPIIIEIIQLLLNQIKKINHKEILNIAANHKETALYKALVLRLEDIAILIIQAGADISLPSTLNQTPLMAAVYSGSSTKTIGLLCPKERAELVNTQDDEGYTALHLVKDPETLKTLLSYKPNVNVKNKLGLTCLHNILAKLGTLDSKLSFEMLELLINAKADVNTQDMLGVTPLMRLERDSDFVFLQLLLKHNADPNIVSLNGETALILYIKTGQSKNVNRLLNDSKVNFHCVIHYKRINEEGIRPLIVSQQVLQAQTSASSTFAKSVSHQELLLHLYNDSKFFDVSVTSPLQTALLQMKPNVALMLLKAYEKKGLMRELKKLIVEQRLFPIAINMGSLAIAKDIFTLVSSLITVDQLRDTMIQTTLSSTVTTNPQGKTDYTAILEWILKTYQERNDGLNSRQNLSNQEQQFNDQLLSCSVQMGNKETLIILLKSGFVLKPMHFLHFYARLFLQSPEFANEHQTVEQLSFNSRNVRRAKEKYNIVTHDTLKICLDILGVLLEAQLSSLDDRSFGMDGKDPAFLALINFLVADCTQLIPNVNGDIILGLPLGKKCVLLTINKDNLGAILEKISELLKVKTEKSLHRGIRQQLISFTNEYRESKNHEEYLKIIEAYEQSVLKIKNVQAEFNASLIHFCKQHSLFRNSIETNHQRIHTLIQVASESSDSSSWRKKYLEKIESRMLDIKKFEEENVQLNNEIQNLQNSNPLNQLPAESVNFLRFLELKQWDHAKKLTDKNEGTLVGFQRDCSKIINRLDSLEDRLNKLVKESEQEIKDVQDLIVRENESFKLKGASHSAKAGAADSSSKKRKSKNKGTPTISSQTQNSALGKTTATSTAGAAPKTPSDPKNVLLNSMMYFRSKVKETEAAFEDYQRMLDKDHEVANVRVCAVEQLKVTMKALGNSSHSSHHFLEGPRELSVDNASGLSTLLSFENEYQELKNILEEVNAFDATKRTLPRILKERNALLGISSRAMDIIKNVKKSHSDIDPQFAEHFRDVLRHAIDDLFPIFVTDVSLNEHLEFHLKVKTMVSKMVSYLQAVRSNKKEQKLAYEQMILDPLFVEIMKYQIKEPDQTTVEIMIKVHQREAALYESKDASEAMLIHARGFSDGRIGAFSAQLSKIAPKAFLEIDCRSYIERGNAYFHVDESSSQLLERSKSNGINEDSSFKAFNLHKLKTPQLSGLGVSNSAQNSTRVSLRFTAGLDLSSKG